VLEHRAARNQILNLPVGKAEFSKDVLRILADSRRRTRCNPSLPVEQDRKAERSGFSSVWCIDIDDHAYGSRLLVLQRLRDVLHGTGWYACVVEAA
jgi:hypothetical protein